MKLDDIKKRVDDLLNFAQELLTTSPKDSMGISVIPLHKFYEFKTSSISFIQNVYGENHIFSKEFTSKVLHAVQVQVEIGFGILTGIKQEIDGGWLFTVKALVSAEIFSDILQMAEYLLSEGYKDAAAVMIGSVLEGHLRQLCLKNSIDTVVNRDSKPIPKKADAMNSDLNACDAYNKLVQKNITSWLDLRNKAAHGHYGEYTKEQVVLMFQGVQNFIASTTT
ncbi:MAG: hypothetical protein JNL32_02290 [Candidatus Kapabacteria bacterium]|nr:hypothetical protein [Candidatus Kapabacteria bacterium]